MRVLFTGGRDNENRVGIYDLLDTLHGSRRITLLIHGACGVEADDNPPKWHKMKGADRIADDWARERGVEVERYPARWRALRRAAGPVRIIRMFDEARPDMVVAVRGNDGTERTVKIARERDIRLLTGDR